MISPGKLLSAVKIDSAQLGRILGRENCKAVDESDLRTFAKVLAEVIDIEYSSLVLVADRPSKRVAKRADAAVEGAWTPVAAPPLRDDFAKLSVASQEGGPCFPLDVSVGLSSIYVKIPAGDDTPVVTATVRVNAGEVLPRGPLKPVDGTILGKDKRMKHVVWDGVRWNFDNPREANINPLAEARLCEMVVIGAGPHVLDLQLRCRDIDLGVTIHSPPPDLDSKQAAMLRRLLQKLGAADPDAEYVDLARVEMRREEKK